MAIRFCPKVRAAHRFWAAEALGHLVGPTVTGRAREGGPTSRLLTPRRRSRRPAFPRNCWREGFFPRTARSGSAQSICAAGTRGGCCSMRCRRGAARFTCQLRAPFIPTRAQPLMRRSRSATINRHARRRGQFYRPSNDAHRTRTWRRRAQHDTRRGHRTPLWHHMNSATPLVPRESDRHLHLRPPTPLPPPLESSTAPRASSTRSSSGHPVVISGGNALKDYR